MITGHLLANWWLLFKVKVKVKLKSFSHAWLLVTPWTGAYQAPPSMGFSRQEYWSGVPLPHRTKWEYLYFSPLLFASLLFTAIHKASPDSHFAFLHVFSKGMVNRYFTRLMRKDGEIETGALKGISNIVHWPWSHLCQTQITHKGTPS